MCQEGHKGQKCNSLQDEIMTKVQQLMYEQVGLKRDIYICFARRFGLQMG